MKKTFKFPVYEVYDLQREINRKAFETVTEAKEYITEIDKIQSEWYAGVPRGPFRHHRFIISEAIYTTVLDVEDDDEPTFEELYKAADDWEYGEYCEVFRFNDK